MSAPELSVVCKSCGSEVSPYVTECPYCGHRLRRRAPDLEREGDEIKVREPRRERRRREKQRRRLERDLEGGRRLPSLSGLEIGTRPAATIAALLAAAILLVVQRAVPLSLAEAGAIVGPVGTDWWRYLVAPFVRSERHGGKLARSGWHSLGCFEFVLRESETQMTFCFLDRERAPV